MARDSAGTSRRRPRSRSASERFDPVPLSRTARRISTVSFDAVRTTAAPIEVHGETGSLSVPDPNMFEGDTAIFRLGGEAWETLPPSAGYVDSGRGVGLIDFAAGHGRASGAIGLHALEIMTGLLEAAESGTRVEIGSTFPEPELVPLTAAETWRA